MSEAPRDDLRQRVDVVEESYEFLLAYAARGLSSDAASGAGAQLRHYLQRTDAALTGVAELFRALVAQEDLNPAECYHAFIAVLERDAQSTRVAVQLVLAQPAISSQLIDNLNASIHLRALLTDLFLIDEILELSQRDPAPATST